MPSCITYNGDFASLNRYLASRSFASRLRRAGLPAIMAVQLLSCDAHTTIELFRESNHGVEPSDSSPPVGDDGGDASAPPTVIEPSMDAGAAGNGITPMPSDAGSLNPPGPSGGGGGSGGMGGVGGTGGRGGQSGGTAGMPSVGFPLPVHRYSFSGTGSVAVDEAGGADGVVLGGAQLAGDGRLILDGLDDYVELPAGIVSVLSSATFISWFEWQSESRICWQRAFCFGNAIERLDGARDAETEIFATPLQCPEIGASGLLRAQGSSVTITSDYQWPAFETHQLGLVVNADTLELLLYIDGQIVAQTITGLRLSDLSDVNNWLGRSLEEQDERNPLRAAYDEFRIYDVALTTEQMAATFAAGPDALASVGSASQ